MKYLLLILFCVSVSFGNITKVQQKDTTFTIPISQTVTVYLPNNPTNGSTLIVCVSSNSFEPGSQILSITETGATWSAPNSHDDDSRGNSEVTSENWSAYNVSGASKTLVFVFNNPTFDVTINISEWSGMLTSTNFEQFAGDDDGIQNCSSSVNTCITSSTSQAYELLITQYATTNDGSAESPQSGFTQLSNQTSPNGLIGIVNYQIVNTVNTYQETPNISYAPSGWVGIISTFKGGTYTPPAGGKPRRRLISY